MTTRLLYDNEQTRRELPLWQLFCFVMFCVWQMGFIYFIGPALNIDGRTPLPISPDNLTVLIVAGYVCSMPKLTPELLRVFIRKIEVFEKTEKYSRTAGNLIVIHYAFRLPEQDGLPVLEPLMSKAMKETA